MQVIPRIILLFNFVILLIPSEILLGQEEFFGNQSGFSSADL
jgi:hypothetical protein